jgi:hypothetical protein
MAKESFELRGVARGGSRQQGQGHRRAPQELTQEVQGTTPARAPHQHQYGLRPLAHHLGSQGNDLVLVASDQRLLRAAQGEGLTTFNPKIQDQTALAALVAP